MQQAWPRIGCSRIGARWIGMCWIGVRRIGVRCIGTAIAGAAVAAALTALVAVDVGKSWLSREVDPPAAAHARRLMLLYVGADDCPPCRTWQQGAGAAFRAAPEFAEVVYREVKSPKLLDVLSDEHWPEDLRNYRSQIDRSAGVPLWILVADETIIARGFGPSQWQAVVLPRLRSLLR